MKRFLLLWMSFILTTALWAYDFQSGDLYYNITSSTEPYTVEVTYQSSWYSGDYNYMGLTSVTIPATVTYDGTTYSVTSIGSSAFENCTGLTSVAIPESVTSIGWYAFSGCTGLTSIVVENGNTVYDSRENCNAIIETATNTLIQGCKTTVIPNSVTSIGGWAFSGCTGLTSITIPESVTSIGDEAFYNVPNIVYNGTATGSPWGARSMNGYVDGYLVYADATKTTLLACSNVATGAIVIPNSVTSIGDKAFYRCTRLTSVTIPNSVTSIGYSAFLDCTGLASITIPNSVTSIGGWAFKYCTGLTSVTIPESVTSIGYAVFSGCTGLTSIVAPAFALEITTYDSDAPEILSYVEIYSGEITDYELAVLLYSYKTLRTLDVRQTTNITLPDEAFRNCYNLQTLRLPANLTTIPYMAVADCKSLQSITIPASVTEIESSAFENCRSLKSVIFEGATTDGTTTESSATSTCSLLRIGNWAFYNCHELQSLSIPEGVTEIGDAAFYGCVYLTDIALPSSMATISDNAFALCSKLQKITVSATTPPTIQAKTFYEVSRTIPVYVPTEAVNDYKSDIYWREFNIQAASAPAAAIDNTSADSSIAPQKVLIDGQVYILRNGKTYTPTGAEVE